MDPETRRQKLDLCSKLEERDALLKLEANLRKQLELINQSKAQERAGLQFPVEHSRLLQSGRNQNTLTNQDVGGGGSKSRGSGGVAESSPTPSDKDNWVFLDPAKL